MSKWQDIAISDANLKAEFITRFFNGDYISAFRIIEDNPQLNTKAFLANIMNEISNLLSLLQNNFQNNVIDYLANELAGFNYLINQFNLRGNWDSETTYEIYNFVVYNNIDYLYINPTPSAGNLPTNTTYWLEINIRGEAGAPGLGVNLKYDWDFSVEYQPLDVVYYNNALWVATITNINKRPDNYEAWQTLVGEVVTFTSNNDLKFKSISANFTPIQNLNGYDNPWPAGGGKNLLNNQAVSATWSNVQYTVNSDGSISTNGTSNGWNGLSLGNQTLKAGTYILSSGVGDAYRYNQYLSATIDGVSVNTQSGDGTEFTVTSETTTFEVKLFTRPNQTPNQTVYPMIRLSSVADSSYAPYANICPISGHTGCDVVVDGKNLLNPDISVYSVGTNYRYLNGVVPDGQVARFTFKDKDTSINISGLYIGFTDNDLSKQTGVTVFRWAISNGVINHDTSNIPSQDFSARCTNVFIYPKTQEAFDKLFARYDILVELGSTASDYEAFQGKTVSISFGTTVYGCKLTVFEDGSGQAVVDRGRRLFNGSEEITSFTSGSRAIYANDTFQYPPDKDGTIISNLVKTSASTATPQTWSVCIFANNGNVIFGIPSNITTQQQWKDFLTANNVEVVYTLDNPITIPVTAEQIQTLVGENNVWVNGSSGDITVELEKKYWEIFLPFKLIKIYSNTTAPTGDDLYNGVIWFEMLTS